MGRAKLGMELISKEKSRIITYQKRKKGLMKKAFELSTLCNIKACMIIYGPKQDDRPIEPEIWPTNSDEVNNVINMYKEKDTDSGKIRTVDLSHFFKDRKKKIEEELTKIRRNNLESQYPTWDDQINDLSESELREFLGALEKKSQVLKIRVEMGKKNGLLIGGSSASELMDCTYTPSGQNRYSYIDHVHVPMHYPSTHHHGQVNQTVQINQNSMMMMMNDHDLMQFGGASSSNNTGYPQFMGPHYFDPMGGTLDSVVYNNARPLMMYYAPSLQPMQASQMHASQVAQYSDFDDDHQINNMTKRY